MPERLYQLGFDEHLKPATPTDVTPEGFAGLEFEKDKEPKLSRFVREAAPHPRVTSPALAAEYLSQHVYTPWEEFDQEELWVLLLNVKQKITHDVMVYRGTVDSIFIRSVELFKEAVRLNAPAVIMAHSHPSDELEPSPGDVRMTRAAGKVARVLDIHLADHLIIGNGHFVSMKNRGLGFG